MTTALRTNILCDLVHLHESEVARLQADARCLPADRAALSRLLEARPPGYAAQAAALKEKIARVRKSVEAAEIAYLLDALPLLNRHHDLESQIQVQLKQPHGFSPELVQERIADLRQQQRRVVARFKQRFRPDLLTDGEWALTDRSDDNRCGPSDAPVVPAAKRRRVGSHAGGHKRPVASRAPMAPAGYSGGGTASGSGGSTQRHCTYKRLNHFREFLRQLQGKSRVDIPPAVFGMIRDELRKQWFISDDPEKDRTHLVTPKIVRRVLRKLKMPRYYEHIPSIASTINPTVQPPSIPPHKEELLAFMFRQTEAPYDRTKRLVKKTRKNFMSYPYVSYKLCELLDWRKYLPHFNLLKSEVLLIYQDQWWELVCAELGWKPIRTIGCKDVEGDADEADEADEADDADEAAGDAGSIGAGEAGAAGATDAEAGEAEQAGDHA